MKKRTRVYLAGPISKGDRSKNLAQFMAWHEALMDSGFAVFNPGLSAMLPWSFEKSHASWLEADIPWVLQSDLVIRLPGESPGADTEVEEATDNGIPVFHASGEPRAWIAQHFTSHKVARTVSDFEPGMVVTINTDQSLSGKKVTPGRQGWVDNVMESRSWGPCVLVYCGPLGQCLAFSPEDLDIQKPTEANEVFDNSLKKFASGAVRSADAEATRFDLISPIGLDRLARTYAEGAKKYGVNNWQKGIPVSDLLNHCLRHVNLYISGDTTEDHMAHAVWNLFTVMHFEKSNPELVDVQARKEQRQNG